MFPKYVPYVFPCVFLNLWSQQKTSPLFSGGFRPHLELWDMMDMSISDIWFNFAGFWFKTDEIADKNKDLPSVD